ncbi:hypothetical protein KP509_17G020000 [Ceratopteris richardii]|uniref:Multiple inositol polyphosphate phosphatase 1 n=1 Tax=Ceratopteris richardii TaxID=49495 RepID=A0A8T2SSL6_CERRI|nr:hypothetical protein KP509_17G020000 [Ceratopteris richardii]KAH7372768.1 hypothetical protein KP509_17G020000 [Ceratopteris richardii]KAH7372769.1 hypothetical protein KP509_17G020000 [Ceratopteris richardii]KAH7372771.1 hypothetical protein KP509_17G020000 [Ceratopteris richardii]
MGRLLAVSAHRVVVLAIVVIVAALSAASDNFHVHEHLSTATRYGHGKMSTGRLFNGTDEIPPKCSPIHINLVARHGTRAPTKKRIKQIDNFAERIREWGNSSQHAPMWMKEWKSPWHGRTMGGEVLQKGEEEMFELAQRIRSRYPDIFKDEYHPGIYTMSATQVPRSAASAVAFGMGLFAGEGSLGPGRHRAFSVISDSRTHDTHLRFYESCSAYQKSKIEAMPQVAELQEDLYVQVALSLQERFKFNITKEDVPVLWFLCKQEAAALDIVDQSCILFTKEEVEMLEWADDLEVHKLKGYGKSINYRIGVPLLTNVYESMERAIAARKGGVTAEKAHFRFAHAETVIPFICLLGLFLDEEDVQKIMIEAALDPPPAPPKNRVWKGSAVAPYGANTMIVLYQCSSTNEDGKQLQDSDFYVQVLHNERAVTLPGCNGIQLCPFEVFKEQVVLPHMKYQYESLCELRNLGEKHDEL